MLSLAHGGFWTWWRQCGRGARGRQAVVARGWGGFRSGRLEQQSDPPSAQGESYRCPPGGWEAPALRGEEASSRSRGHALQASKPWLRRGRECRGTQVSQNACPEPCRLPGLSPDMRPSPPSGSPTGAGGLLPGKHPGAEATGASVTGPQGVPPATGHRWGNLCKVDMMGGGQAARAAPALGSSNVESG